jgi:tetratricopeptide (TPR) repeat protein
VANTGLAETVGAELQRLLSTPPLASSPSLRRLLSFLVEETLAGKSADINEYNVGLRVFNRGPDFNPRSDPIVRVQTHHLRSRLAQYYSQAAGGAMVIELPPRTYVPVFHSAELPGPPPDVVEQSAAPEPQARRSAYIPLAVTAVVALAALAGLALLGRSRPAERPALHHVPDPVAQDWYIRGRYLLDRLTEPALLQSIGCFEQATARDPQFAAAFAALADAHNMLAQFGYVPPSEGMEQARRAAKHALALDPNLAEGYVALAAILEAYDWNFREAERQYRRAIQLNPQLPAAHLWYGMFLRDQGRLKEAMPEFRRAEELEPFSVLANTNMAHALRMAGDSDAALERTRRAVEMDPDLPDSDVMLANIYRSRSDAGDADAALDRALSLAAGNPHALSILACTYARLGRRAESLRLFQQMQQLATRRYVSPYDLGNVALMLGYEDRAVTWLEEAYRQRSTGMIFLRYEKAGSIMHSPRLRALIAKMGIG